MKNKKGTQYQSHAKRRIKKDALGRPMRSPSFGIKSTPNGYVVSEFVANQVMRKHPSLTSAFQFVHTERKDSSGNSFVKTTVKPVPFKHALRVRNAVSQWAMNKFAQVERQVMKQANERHKDLSSAFKRIKVDEFRRNGTVKEHIKITEHARKVRELQENRAPLALIGLEMIKQGIIV